MPLAAPLKACPAGSELSRDRVASDMDSDEGNGKDGAGDGDEEPPLTAPSGTESTVLSFPAT